MEDYYQESKSIPPLSSINNTFGNQSLSQRNKPLSGRRSNSPFNTNNSTALYGNTSTQIPTSQDYYTLQNKTPDLSYKSKYLNAPSHSGNQSGTLNYPVNMSLNNSLVTLPYGSNNSRTVSPYKDNILSAVNETMAKKLSDVESQLVRERAKNNLMERERELNEARTFQQSSQRKGFFTSRQEFARLTNLIQDQDLHITKLINDLSQRPAKESLQAERNNFHKSFSALQNTINQLENKFVMVMTENQRLCRQLEDQDREYKQRCDTINFQSTSISFGYQEKLKDLQSQLDRLIVENEKISLINQTYAKKIQETQEMAYNNDRRSIEEREDIIKKTAINFEQQKKDLKERHELELLQMENRIKFMKESLDDAQCKIHNYLVEIEGLRKQNIHKEADIDEQRRRNNLFQKKLIDYEEMNQQLNESCIRINELELQINVLISQNERVSNIAEFRAQELANLQKLHDAETQKFNHQIEQMKIHYDSTYKAISQSQKQRFEKNFEYMNEEQFKLNEQYSQLIGEFQSQMRDLKTIQMRYEEVQNKLSQTSKHLEETRASNEREILDLSQDQRNLVSRIVDMQNTVQKLLTDNKNLNNLLSSRIEEVQILNQKLEQTENLLVHNINDLQASHQEAIKQIEDRYLSEIQRLRGLHNQELMHYQAKTFDKEQVIEHLIREKDQLNDINYQIRSDIEQFQLEMQRLEGELDVKHYQIQKSEIENNQLRGDLAQSDKLIMDTKTRLIDLQTQFEKIRRILNGKCQELASVKSCYEFTEDENSKKRLHIAQLGDKVNLLVGENEALKREIADLDGIVNFDKQEFEKLTIDQERLIQVFQQEVEKSNMYANSLNETIMHLKLELDQSNLKVSEGKNQQDFKEREIQELRKFLDSEKQQADKSHFEMKQLFEDVQNIDRQKQRMEFELDSLNNQYRLEISNQESQIRNYQAEIDSVQQQSLNQIDNISNKLIQLENHHNKEINEQKQHYQRLLQSENEKYNQQIQSLRYQHSEQIQNFNKSNELMMEEVEALKELNQNQRLQSDNRFMRIRELEQQLYIKLDLERAYLTDIEIRQSSYENLLHEFTKLKEHNSNVVRDMELWQLKSQQIDPSHPMVIDLKNQIENLRSEIYQLKVGEIQRDDYHPIYRPPPQVRAPPPHFNRIKRNPSSDFVRKNHSFSIDHTPDYLGAYNSNNSNHDFNNILNENENLNRAILNRCQNIAQKNYF